MRVSSCLPLLVLALACNKHLTLDDEAVRNHFNELGPHRKGSVVLHDGRRIRARGFRADADSLWFLPRTSTTAAPQAFP